MRIRVYAQDADSRQEVTLIDTDLEYAVRLLQSIFIPEKVRHIERTLALLEPGEGFRTPLPGGGKRYLALSRVVAGQ